MPTLADILPILGGQDPSTDPNAVSDQIRQLMEMAARANAEQGARGTVYGQGTLQGITGGRTPDGVTPMPPMALSAPDASAAPAPAPAPAPPPAAAPAAAPATPPTVAPRGFFQRLQDISRAAGLNLPNDYAGNQTIQALVQHGLDPTTAQALIANPSILQQVAPQVLVPNKTVTINPGQVITDNKGNIIFDNRENKLQNVPAGNTGYIPDGRGGFKAVASGGLTEGDRKLVQTKKTELDNIKTAIDLLDKAKGYSDNMLSGPGAVTDANFTNAMGQMFGKIVPDQLKQKAANTQQFEALMTSTALAKIKQDVGGRANKYVEGLEQAIRAGAGESNAVREGKIRDARDQLVKHAEDVQREIAQMEQGQYYSTPGTAAGGVGAPSPSAPKGADPLGLR